MINKNILRCNTLFKTFYPSQKGINFGANSQTKICLGKTIINWDIDKRKSESLSALFQHRNESQSFCMYHKLFIYKLVAT